MLIDLLKQAYEAMQYNRRRTIITVAGMAWGIATVVLLLAYGAGFSRAIMAIFAQWGVNSIGVFPGTTSEQAGGKKAGVRGALHAGRLERLSASVPGPGTDPDRHAGEGQCGDPERPAHLYLAPRRKPSRESRTS